LQISYLRNLKWQVSGMTLGVGLPGRREKGKLTMKGHEAPMLSEVKGKKSIT